METQLDMAKEFMTQIKAQIHNHPTVPNAGIRNFRADLIREEVQELLETIEYPTDLDKTAKELADVLYVVYGTILSYGLQDKMAEIFEAVHDSNMLKKRRKDSANNDSKAIKDETYTKPDIQSIIESD